MRSYIKNQFNCYSYILACKTPKILFILDCQKHPPMHFIKIT